jgi:hypothetical protein
MMTRSVTMDRTVGAALLAAFIAFAAVAGFGVFLGFDTTGSIVAGLVLGLLSGLLLWGASRRAETFHEPTPPSPRFPGPPDHADGTPADPADPAHETDASEADER